jgi:hypothetical protein
MANGRNMDGQEGYSWRDELENCGPLDAGPGRRAQQAGSVGRIGTHSREQAYVRGPNLRNDNEVVMARTGIIRPEFEC